MLKLKYMNNFANKGPGSSESENSSRRGFLKKMLGGALTGVAVVAGVRGVDKYVVGEDKLNELYASFEGKQEDFEKAHEAASMLMIEMEKSKVEKVRLSGEGNPNNKIEILRDFLTSHINSHVGHKYSFREKFLVSGFYTKESLLAIQKESTLFTK
jgi:hypothetical protein